MSIRPVRLDGRKESGLPKGFMDYCADLAQTCQLAQAAKRHFGRHFYARPQLSRKSIMFGTSRQTFICVPAIGGGNGLSDFSWHIAC